MNVLPLLLFVSLVLAVSALLFFLWNQARGNAEHADRLAILPFLDELDDAPRRASEPLSSKKETPNEDD